MGAPEFTQVRPGGALAALPEADRQAALASIGERILESPQGAWQDAVAALGPFPVIVLAHGLGGNHATWGTFTEFLASHGYVVAAPTFVSDGSLPLVFHDDDSPFRNQHEWSQVAAAYERMFNEAKVVPYFHRLLFDGEADAAKRKAVPGGVERATIALRPAGGDPKQVFPLAAERAAPDRFANPPPVALRGWQRALSDLILAIVRGTGHDTLVNEAARLFPWPAFMRGELPFGQTLRRTRKATGEAAFAPNPPVGEPFDELGWGTLADGQETI